MVLSGCNGEMWDLRSWTRFLKSRSLGPGVRQTAGFAMTLVACFRLEPGHPQTGFALRPVMEKYCVTCHNQRLKTAGLILDTLDMNNPAANAANWKKSSAN